MKILWISNVAFGPMLEILGQKQYTSGGWINAAYEALQKFDEIELTVITSARVKEIKRKRQGNGTFFVIPGGFPVEYNHKSLKNRNIWLRIKEECQPDLIQVWGTEYTHGYLALEVMAKTPAVIYMQGVLNQIARHYTSCIPEDDLRKYVTIRDIIKRDSIKQRQKNFLNRSKLEGEIIRIAGNVIVENKWCEIQCKSIAPNCSVFKSYLSISERFFDSEWRPESMQSHTIMSNAAGYPIKGLHILLKALKLVINEYPDTRLYIPGEPSPYNTTFMQKCRRNGYTKYIIHLIDELGLKNNIHFLGRVSSTKLVEQLAASNVFVMPSSIENHSSSLMEAMIVGTPCIASYVGGIPEYLIHEVNGLIYRFEEHEVLAAYIKRIFGDPDFAARLASNGRVSMRQSRRSHDTGEELNNIYRTILGG